MDVGSSKALPVPVPPHIGTPQQLRWLHGIVKATIALNLLDVVFTLVWVSNGLAREANPLLASLVLEHPVLFSIIKTSLVGLASLLFWQFRFRPLAVVGIFGAFLIYYWIVLYHLRYLNHFVRWTMTQ